MNKISEISIYKLRDLKNILGNYIGTKVVKDVKSLTFLVNSNDEIAYLNNEIDLDDIKILVLSDQVISIGKTQVLDYTKYNVIMNFRGSKELNNEFIKDNIIHYTITLEEDFNTNITKLFRLYIVFEFPNCYDLREYQLFGLYYDDACIKQGGKNSRWIGDVSHGGGGVQNDYRFALALFQSGYLLSPEKMERHENIMSINNKDIISNVMSDYIYVYNDLENNFNRFVDKYGFKELLKLYDSKGYITINKDSSYKFNFSLKEIK